MAADAATERAIFRRACAILSELQDDLGWSDVKPKFSHGKIIEGNDDLKSGFSLYKYILRPYEEDKSEEIKQQQQKKKEAHETNIKKLESLKNESESDW